MSLFRLAQPVPRDVEISYARWEPCGIPEALPPAAKGELAEFKALCELRRTRYGGQALSRSQLSNVLWLTAKELSCIFTAGEPPRRYKPVISAGAKHPIWLLVVENVSGCRPTAYFYDDELHALRPARWDSDVAAGKGLGEALASCRSASGTLVLFAADWQLTAAKYVNPESLLWRDAGALLQQFSLAASALGLNCIPMGKIGENLLVQVTEAAPLLALGGCLLHHTTSNQ